MRSVSLAFLTASFFLGSPAAHASDDLKKLDSGEILLRTVAIEGSDFPAINLRGVINASPEKVWTLIEDCTGYKNVMPRVSESEQLERNGNTARCRTKIDSPWPMKDLESIVKVNFEVSPGQKWVRSWMLESGDFDRNEGSWTLTPFENDPTRTLAEYNVLTKPKTSVPGAIREFAQKSALPDIIKRLRKKLAQ